MKVLDDTLTGNLEALTASGGALPGGESDNVRVHWQDPWPTAEIRCDDGRWVALHSKRDPMAEARRWIAQAQVARPKGPESSGGAESPEGAERADGRENPVTFIVIGAGLGYVLDVIEQDLPGSRVIVLESEPALARALLSRRDWREPLQHGRLKLLIGPEYAGASQAWRVIDGETPPVVLAHPVLERELPSRRDEGMRIVKRLVFDAAANQRARREMGTIYFTQTLRNLPRMLNAAPVSALDGRGAGWPAVICGAGPSLDDNLKHAAAFSGRVITIATDTSLRPLLSHAIEPDYVVGLDPTALNARHLTGLGMLRHAWLVADPSLAPAALDGFGERLCAFRVSDNHPWPAFLGAGFDPGHLPVWGSVLTACFSLALRLGCDPIVFAGSDLAYTGTRPYARDTIFETDWARCVLEGSPLAETWRRLLSYRELIDAEGIDGAAVQSAPHLLAVREWLVERSRAAKVAVINASGTGVLATPRIESMASLLERLPAHDVPYDPAPPADAKTTTAVRVAVARALRAGAEDRAATRTWLSAAPALSRDDLRALLDEVATALETGASMRPGSDHASAISPATAVFGMHHLPEVVAVFNARRCGLPPPEDAHTAMLENALPTESAAAVETASPAERAAADARAAMIEHAPPTESAAAVETASPAERTAADARTAMIEHAPPTASAAAVETASPAERAAADERTADRAWTLREMLAWLIDAPSLTNGAPGARLALLSRPYVAPELRAALTADWTPSVRSIVNGVIARVAREIEGRGGRAPIFSANFAAHCIKRGVAASAAATSAATAHAAGAAAAAAAAAPAPTTAAAQATATTPAAAGAAARPANRAPVKSRAARAEERRGRTAITALGMLAAYGDEDDLRCVMLRRALEGGLEIALNDVPRSSTDAALRFHVRAGGRSWRFALRAPIATLTGADHPTRVLAGAIFPDQPRTGVDSGTQPRVTLCHASPLLDVSLSIAPTLDALDPRRLYLTEALAWLRVRWLTDEGLTPCLMGSQLDARRAALTSRPSTNSLAIDADGSITPLASWPTTIVSEIHNDRWQMAWSQQPVRQLLARRPDSGGGDRGVYTAALDALPFTAAWIGPETVAVSTSAGLWRWTPGSQPERIADVPPGAIVTVEGDKVHLDPIPLSDAGALTRERRAVGWTVDHRSGRIEERALGLAAQAWGRASCGDFVATAHPESDVIRIERADGSTGVWLAWPGPRGVAWLEDSLLVWGRDGAVGRVSALRQCLAALPPLVPGS